MMSKALDKIKKITSNEESSWLEEANTRQANKAWRKRSFKIAARILIEIRRQKPLNGMTQKMLAEKMDVAPQYINKVVKGQENLTLETIAKFEEILGITLVDIVEPEANIETKSKELISNDVLSRYSDVYNKHLGVFHKVFFLSQEDEFITSHNDDWNTLIAKFHKNELVDKLSSFCLAVLKDKSDLKENNCESNIYDFIKNSWVVRMDEIYSNKSNQNVKIIWNPSGEKERFWGEFTNKHYSEKDKYEYEG